MTDQEIVEQFHRLFYNSVLDTWASTFWLGVATEKYPCDLWVYQEIIQELQPDFIVETGTRFGGSALFMASVCELLGHGHVITVDIAELASTTSVRPPHARVTYLTGSSTSPETVDKVRAEIDGAKTVMVVLDSDHHMTHVVDELRIYSDVVTDGSYLIVEDTNINGHPAAESFGHGPMEAVELFLSGSKDYVVDRSREKFLVTFNPRGFLRKVAEGGPAAKLWALEHEVVLAAESVRQADARAEQEAARAEQEAARAEQEAAHAEKEATHAAREADRANREEAVVSAKEGIIEETRAQLAELDQRMTELAEVHQAVVDSASWRLTAPLRKLKRLFK